MDTRQVIARFEAERQALALMDHPNIAKVLDGGATENGRPYFVMELVKGIPITRYCDERQLNTQARLNLFIQVCQAVQHAHQKGIIHRDLKPSNILVADQQAEKEARQLADAPREEAAHRNGKCLRQDEQDEQDGLPFQQSPNGEASCLVPIGWRKMR
jgi:serine/threonine protein kinase